MGKLAEALEVEPAELLKLPPRRKRSLERTRVLAYCLFVTLKQRLKTLAPGLTPRAVLEKLAAMQMIDVELPTTDNRVVVLSRYTEPEKDLLLLLRQLQIQLPAQPPPKTIAKSRERSPPVVPTFGAVSQGFQYLGVTQPPQLVKSG